MLPELIVLSFPTKLGAKNFLEDLIPLHEEHLIRIEDAALAAKDEKGRVHGGARTDLAAHGLLSGSLWGTLTGALFLEPFLGMILGGLIGMLTGGVLNQAQSGISPRTVSHLANRTLEPNSSALFLLVSKMTLDKVAERMYRHDASIVRTSLSHRKERQLRAAWKKVREDGPLALHEPAKPRFHTDSAATRLLPESAI